MGVPQAFMTDYWGTKIGFCSDDIASLKVK